MDFLKLVAFDAEDLRLVAAHVQDAVVKVGDLVYHPRQKKFIIPMNRFAWEQEKKSLFRRGQHQRHQSLLHFDRVQTVRAIGIDKSRPEDILSLLTVNFVRATAPSGTIELIFSGEAALSLEVECIEARLADTGAAWGTQARPRHID